MLYNKAMDKKGIALIAVIMLITFISVAVLGTSAFIAQRLIGVNVQQRDMRCRYNAQAGLNYAIYQYRNSGTLYSGNDIAIDPLNSFSVSTAGSAASSLTVDATGSTLASSNRNLVGITLANSSSASAITIDRMIVTWTGSSRTLQNIRINNSNVWNTNVSSSPADLDITDTAIAVGDTANLTRVRWNSSMTGRTITLQFVFTDGSTSNACTVYPAPGSACSGGASTTLTITSMGKTSGSGMYRSVQATYTVATGNISNYSETTAAVP